MVNGFGRIFSFSCIHQGLFPSLAFQPVYLVPQREHSSRIGAITT
jgi:hypothetical protein